MSQKISSLIILECIRKLNGERTVYSIYHLLKGKKSSQTIQDAHLFEISMYFGCLDLISRNDFDAIVGNLHTEKLLQKTSDQSFVLTKEGLNVLNKSKLEGIYPKYLNGWKHHKVKSAFFERLTLFVQVCSNLQKKERGYVPVTKRLDTLDWIKSVLIKFSKDKPKLSECLYDELFLCFESLKDVDPSLLVIRLTGYKWIGLTPFQAAEYFGLDLPSYHIQLTNIIHYMLDEIYHDKENYPLLFELTKGVGGETELTLSAQKTLELLNAGYSLEQIAEFRRLKANTIQDHIVEIVLHEDEFDISGYVAQSTQKEIIKAFRQSETKQLKYVRERVKEASYFEIRLVLARYGGL